MSNTELIQKVLILAILVIIS